MREIVRKKHGTREFRRHGYRGYGEAERNVFVASIVTVSLSHVRCVAGIGLLRRGDPGAGCEERTGNALSPSGKAPQDQCVAQAFDFRH